MAPRPGISRPSKYPNVAGGVTAAGWGAATVFSKEKMEAVEAEVVTIARAPGGRFAQGVSGNPAGRPPSKISRGEIIRAFLEGKAAGASGELDRLTAMVMSMYRLTLDEEAEAKDRVAAFNALCNQGYGKPPSSVEVSGEVKGSVNHSHLHGAVDTMAIIRGQLSDVLEDKRKRALKAAE